MIYIVQVFIHIATICFTFFRSPNRVSEQLFDRPWKPCITVLVKTELITLLERIQCGAASPKISARDEWRKNPFAVTSSVRKPVKSRTSVKQIAPFATEYSASAAGDAVSGPGWTSGHIRTLFWSSRVQIGADSVKFLSYPPAGFWWILNLTLSNHWTIPCFRCFWPTSFEPLLWCDIICSMSDAYSCMLISSNISWTNRQTFAH